MTANGFRAVAASVIALLVLVAAPVSCSLQDDSSESSIERRNLGADKRGPRSPLKYTDRECIAKLNKAGSLIQEGSVFVKSANPSDPPPAYFPRLIAAVQSFRNGALLLKSNQRSMVLAQISNGMNQINAVLAFLRPPPGAKAKMTVRQATAIDYLGGALRVADLARQSFLGNKKNQPGGGV
ncbi:hypothetical protein CLOM_g11941 [Closterium sp. NIES-68]|nr:hypothetical protein CLOM_g11941 [Closterium sp. NIES-68]